MRAVVLYSGGLDSNLALNMILDQGIEALALTFFTPFTTSNGPVSRIPKVDYRSVTFGRDYVELVKEPPHGWGKNMNPCIDCRIFTLRRAHEVMEEVGASFLVTGEVLGQRPMSQRRDTLRLIEKTVGLEGLILRPLSAKLLPLTIPESEGWVKREPFLDLSGRSRKPQIELARHWGIAVYPNPAGGCKLTEPGFSSRFREALSFGEDDLFDIELLKVGRHFRLPSGAKVVVGRDRKENGRLVSLAFTPDYLLGVVGHPGPLTLLRSGATREDLQYAASLCARYSDGQGKLEVKVWRGGKVVDVLAVLPFEERKILEHRIE